MKDDFRQLKDAVARFSWLTPYVIVVGALALIASGVLEHLGHKNFGIPVSWFGLVGTALMLLAALVLHLHGRKKNVRDEAVPDGRR